MDNFYHGMVLLIATFLLMLAIGVIKSLISQGIKHTIV